MKIGLDFQQHLIDELQKMAESTDAQEVKGILRRYDDSIASRERTATDRLAVSAWGTST